MKHIAVLLIPVLLLTGCAATQVAISKRNLDVQTKMSATIFLDPVKPELRTVFIQMRNTSDKAEFSIANLLRDAIAAKGYRVVEDPNTAQFILQANILQVGKTSPTAAEALLRTGYGVPLNGSAVNSGILAAGAGYAAGMGNNRSLLAVGLLGTVVDTVANSAVKDVYYSATTDIQLKERTTGPRVKSTSEHKLAQGTSGGTQTYVSEESDWKVYQTRILSSANKMNLEWEEAVQPLKEGLTRAISGLF